jgi:membrane protease YdiL (CAAX protease family)
VKNLASGILLLTLLAVAAAAVVRLQLPMTRGILWFTFFLALALTLGAFVALADSRVVRRLRGIAMRSMWMALAMPLVLLAPYFIDVLGTTSFHWQGLLKLLGYLLIPTLLLLPDRRHAAAKITWRDCAAMAVLGVPVAAGWLGGIWRSPGGIPFFRPLYSVCAGGYAFLAVRNLQDVGYRLIPRKQDLTSGAASFAGFFIIAIPAGYALHFIQFHLHSVSAALFVVEFVGTYVMIAIPEEFLFRGILQNLLEKSIRSKNRGNYALIVASVIFGVSHMHHPPVPNWRYGIMATLAGLFYGNAYRDRRRLPASAFTHTLVDVVWHFWF